MLKAKMFFVICSGIILLVGNLTTDLSAQTLDSPHYGFSDGSLPVDSSVTSKLCDDGTSRQGCGIYGSCASPGCQNQTCADSNCASNCGGCGKCGTKGAVAAHFQSCRQKRLEYFQFPPAPSCPGDRLYQLIGAQQANGRLAQLVFYNFHFGYETGKHHWTLSPAGVNNVHRIARIWPSTPGTIIVEPIGDANVDQARLHVVQNSLAASGIQAEVRLGRPPAVGLPGVEAINIYEQRLLNEPLTANSSQSTQSFGRSGAASGGGGSR